MSRVRVLLADDQEMVRAGLRMVIDGTADLDVVADVGGGAEAVAAAFELRPDVAVLDVRMPGVDGIDATARILDTWPHQEPPPRVLVLTTFDLDDYVHAALRAGASGFVLKNSSGDRLADAIRAVAAGEVVLAPPVTRRLVRAFVRQPVAATDAASEPDRALLRALTARELDVLVLVATGLSNADVAARLGLSESAVKSRVNRMLGRLGLANRVQAALLVRRAGLLD
ncbi:response regulator transcription factor [Actinomycetes bacterium KLBMP 9759]